MINKQEIKFDLNNICTLFKQVYPLTLARLLIGDI